jgi:hypothetical protein
MKLDRSLVGKIVKVHIPSHTYPNTKVKVDARYVVGECTFAGFNWLLGKKQITVNRTPIFPVREEDVEIL